MTAVRPLVAPARLRAALDRDAEQALEQLLARVTRDPRSIGHVFPAAARSTARGDLGEGLPRIEDAVRVELLAVVAEELGPAELVAELEELYRYGDADEKRAVIQALSSLETHDLDGSALLLDALRTNDVRLVRAAMGPHSRRLSMHDWRHGVLKCLFVGVPLTDVADLPARADDELAAMVRRYVEERRAAGREVPADAETLLALTSATPTTDRET